MTPCDVLVFQLQVTASTSVLMILFSSSAISLSFYFQHLLNTSYAQILAPACFVASLIGADLLPALSLRSIVLIVPRLTQCYFWLWCLFDSFPCCRSAGSLMVLKGDNLAVSSAQS